MHDAKPFSVSSRFSAPREEDKLHSSQSQLGGRGGLMMPPYLSLLEWFSDRGRKGAPQLLSLNWEAAGDDRLFPHLHMAHAQFLSLQLLLEVGVVSACPREDRALPLKVSVSIGRPRGMMMPKPFCSLLAKFVATEGGRDLKNQAK